jgi:hypothetical protein
VVEVIASLPNVADVETSHSVSLIADRRTVLAGADALVTTAPTIIVPVTAETVRVVPAIDPVNEAVTGGVGS